MTLEVYRGNDLDATDKPAMKEETTNSHLSARAACSIDRFRFGGKQGHGTPSKMVAGPGQATTNVRSNVRCRWRWCDAKRMEEGPARELTALYACI